MKKIFGILIALALVLSVSLVAVPAVEANGVTPDRVTVIINAADKLVTVQNTDGGFPWVLPSTGTSYTNVLGITAMGILKAWELDDKASYETALAKAYDYCVDKPPTYTNVGGKWEETTSGVDSFPDITFLAWLSQAAAGDASLLNKINTLQDPDITAGDIASLAKERWDNKVNHLGATPPSEEGTATAMAQRIRDDRHSQGWDTLIPWDLETGVKAAQVLDGYYPGEGYAQQAVDIAEVIYDSIDDTGNVYFDSTNTSQEDYIAGLTGGIEAFREVGLHLGKAAELVDLLLAEQQSGGYWDYYGATPVSKSVQATAYAIMALQDYDTEAVTATWKAATWLSASQKGDGGWYAEGSAGDEIAEIDSEAAWALARLPAPVTVESSTMVFEGELTDAGGGVYTGTIAMTEGEYYVPGGPGEGIWDEGGFDVYAEEGGCAYSEGYYGTGEWNCDGTDTYKVGYYTGTDHDAYPSLGGPWGDWYNPDCADWDHYSLELTADHWYLRYTATGESPMSGLMYWHGDGTGYAAETDPGTVRNDDGSNPTDPLNRDATRYASGSAQEWGWHCGWGEERIPLELSGFVVEVNPSGSYVVTLTPADGPVKNLNTDVTYGNIQSAVDDASPGDTIQVSAGTYAPFTVVSKTDLTIQSSSVVTVQGLQVVTTNYGDRDAVVFVSDSTDIVLDGLTIGPNTGKTQEKDYGVIYENSTGEINSCTVSPNTTGDMYSQAIGIWDGSDVIIDPCVIEDFGRIGVFIYNGCTVEVLDSTIEGQVYSGEGEVCYGIEVEASTDDPSTACEVAIEGVEIYNCDNTYVTGPTWDSGGVYINGWLEYQPQADSTVTIKNCDIHNNYIGIIAVKSSLSYAHFNNICDNRDRGVDSIAAHDASTADFDATYNWWGAASGPYHSTNPSGTGDAVSDHVDFDPWAQAEFPTVTTQAATAVDTDSATLHMTYTMGSYDSVDVRFAYKKSVHSAWSYTTWVPKSAAGTHTEMLTGLDSGTQYDFKAQLRYDEIVYGEKTIGGATLKFTTVAVPTVATQAATEIGYLLATFNMDYTVGGLSPVQVRFAYKKSTDTEWHYTTWVSKAADGSYAHRVAGLRAGTTYNFKAQLKYDDAPLIEGSTRGFGTHTIAVGCFIATAAYGTPSAEQIDVLREFRDTVLLESTLGSQFVALYYQLSPPVAEFIAGNELLRTMVRELLVDPIVGVVEATGGVWRN